MKEKRFVEDAEPYNLYCSHNTNTIYVGDGLPDVPTKHFAAKPFSTSNYLRARLKIHTSSFGVSLSSC